jgi:DNA-binding beta-propeller fold protein YncE
MRGIGLLGICAVVLLPFGTSQRPLPLRAPQAATASLTGFVYAGGSGNIAHVDPATLGATDRSPSSGYPGAWVRSPDGGQLAVATASGSADSSLRFVDPVTLEWRAGGVQLGSPPASLLWPSAGTVLAVVTAGTSSSVERIDVAAQKVVARTPFAGAVAGTRRSADGLVLLLQSPTAIRPARLATVAADGSVRTVVLRKIPIGLVWRWKGSNPVGTIRQPGLTIDPDGGRAYVVDPSGLVAVVDLARLTVAYHRPAKALLARLAAWLTPPAEAKGLSGPVRTAQWLGDGLIAVTGSDESAVKKQATWVFSSRPSGLAVLDTHDWSLRTLDARAGAGVIADGVLLATGSAWSSDSTAVHGEGVAAYGPQGELRWRLGDGTRRYVMSTFGSLAVLGNAAGGAYDVVDVHTGAIVRSGVSGPFPSLLLGPGS